MEEMDTDAFLAHYGVMGMRWGQRKRSEMAVGTPNKANFETKEAYKIAKEKARKARSTFRGNEMIKNAGSAKAAKRQIIGRMIVKQLMFQGGSDVATHLTRKNPKVAIGLRTVAGIGSWAALINDINQYQDVRRANGDKK